MSEESLSVLKDLKTNLGYQLIIERRTRLLENTKRRALSAKTWEEVLKLQGEAAVYSIDEREALIAELETELAKRK